MALSLTQDQITEVRASQPDAFPDRAQAIRRWAPWAIALAYLLWSLWFFDFGKLMESSDRVLRLLAAFVTWEDMATWNYGRIYAGILETLGMAFLGTLLGAVGSLFVGFLAARNVVRLAAPRHAVRRFLDIFRGIDQVVWALVFVRAVGLGPLAGVMAIFISDLGTLSKLFSEAIENVDKKEIEGIRATGAGPLKVICYGYLPQVAPVMLSQTLYFFESATRTATILGVVGAGGIGMIIIERFRATLYDQVAFVVLNVLIVVAIIDWLSGRLRSTLIGR